jgi:hypothetical protein
MLDSNQSGFDRRSGIDGRKAHDLEYLLNGGVERRAGEERRSKAERRKGWVRLCDYSSVYIGEFEDCRYECGLTSAIVF